MSISVISVRTGSTGSSQNSASSNSATMSTRPCDIEDSFRGNLPRRLGRLIGRDEELDTIGDALATYPVVTLVGPGGIGKTRLAVAAARRAEVGGDAWLIELAEISSSSDVPRVVADTLGLTERPGATLTESIVAAARVPSSAPRPGQLRTRH